MSPTDFINLVFYVIDGLGLTPIIWSVGVITVAIWAFQQFTRRS